MTNTPQNDPADRPDVTDQDVAADVELDLGALDESSTPSDLDQAESSDGGLNLDFESDFDASDEDQGGELNLNFGEDDAEQAEASASEQDDEGGSMDLDEALEKALAELRADLESKFGLWYVIHTYSGMENKVKQNLDARATTLDMTDYIFETIVPTETVDEIRNGTRKQVTRVVLPGYVLVRMDLTDDSWQTVRHTPQVTGFVGNANNPLPLTIDEVMGMLTPMVKAQVNTEVQGKPTAKTRKKVEVVDYTVGDSVQIIDGPFAGVHASITEINQNSQRLIALVEILGRETPVDLTFSQIQKV